MNHGGIRGSTACDILLGEAAWGVGSGGNRNVIAGPCEAFPFLFKAQLAMPDMKGVGKVSGREEESQVELAEFTELCSLRCEHQFGAEWCFSYVRWNYLFRQLLHQSRGLFVRRLAGYGEGEEVEVTPQDLKKAAMEISEGLSAMYRGLDGQLRPVAGDLNKVAYIPGLSPLSGRLLQQVKHTISKVTGTTGVRTQMRFRGKSMQVANGTPLFVTLSPAEKHNYCTLCLARWRVGDPAVQRDPALQKVAGRMQPDAEERMVWPNFEERRKILALKPAAAVMGFRVHMLLLLRGLFGLRMCLFCPRSHRRRGFLWRHAGECRAA